MKKFLAFLLTAVIIAGIVCGIIFIPWEKIKSDDSEFPETKLNFNVEQSETGYYPTLTGNVKFNFCPNKVTISMNDVEQDVRPYTTVYVTVGNEYYYVLSFNNVIYYDTLKAGEYTATINAYKDGEIAGKQDVALSVEKSMHLFQKFNPTTGETVKCMNADKSDVWINDDFNNSETSNSYYEKSGMSTDGLGQVNYGLVPTDKFDATIDLNAEGYITYKVSAEEGYVLGNVKLNSYVTFMHGGVVDDYETADIKVQISYDNETFTDVYSLRNDTEIVDTWVDGKTYYGAKGEGLLNGLLYTNGQLEGMEEVPVKSPASNDCRYYINQEINLSGYVNTVYVRLVCINKAATNKVVALAPTRIHNVQITAAQI